MPIETAYIHTLAIERTSAGALDDYGQPSQTWAVLATVPGLIQPKSAREVMLASQGGAAVSLHTIFTGPTDVTTRDRIRKVPDDGRLFEIIGVRDYDSHLELDTRVIV